MPSIVHRGHTLCEATCGLRFEGEALTCGVSHRSAVIHAFDQLNNEGV